MNTVLASTSSGCEVRGTVGGVLGITGAMAVSFSFRPRLVIPPSLSGPRSSRPG